MAELLQDFEGEGGAWILDGTVAHHVRTTVRRAADDRLLGGEPLPEQEGELGLAENELAGEACGGQLLQSFDVAGAEGGEIGVRRRAATEGDEARRQATAAGLNGLLDIAGAGALIRACRRLAGWERLAESGLGVLASLDGRGAALRQFLGGAGAAGAAGPPWLSAVGFDPHGGQIGGCEDDKAKEGGRGAVTQVSGVAMLTGGLWLVEGGAVTAPPSTSEELTTKRLRGPDGGMRNQNIADDETTLDGWTAYLLSVRGRAPATVRRYRTLAERLLRDCGCSVAELRRPAIEAHLRRLFLAGHGESARQGTLVAIRSLGEWCLAHGLVDANPGAGLSGPRPYRREIRVLSVAEIHRLLWGQTPGALPRDPRELRNRALLGVAYIAGLRASEIGPLEAEGLMWQESTQTYSILIKGAKASRGDVRLPLDVTVSRILAAYLAVRSPGRYLWGRPLSRGAVRKILATRLAEVGISPGGRRLSPHILRHSIATHLLDAGLDIRDVQLLLRHRSIATTEIYLHADVARLGAKLVRRSPLSGRRRKPELRPALNHLLGELQALARPSAAE